MMLELLQAYMEKPDPGSFTALRSAYLNHPEVNPYSSDLESVPRLIMDGKHPEALTLIKKHIFPGYFLSPGTHMNYSICLESTGETRHAGFERYLAIGLLDGIKLTGDGSLERPYLVTRTSDEYDFLMSEGLRPTGQALLKPEGRTLDSLTVEDGRTFYFDVSDIYAMMARAFGEGAS